jgi:hypothetical protein
MSKTQSPIDECVVHGVKTVGDYDYYLLVDSDGSAYIERVKSDDSTILFCKMALNSADDTLAEKATTIDNFWSTPSDASHVYKYLFQC